MNYSISFNQSATETIFNSTDFLSTIITDIANVFVLPPLCLIGMLLNLICIIVILQPELKGEIYSFMLFHSICDFIFLLICFFTFIIRCGSFCKHSYTYGAKTYELFIYLFIGNSFLQFDTLIDILVSFNRLNSFSLNYKNPTSSINKFKGFDLKSKCILLIICSLLLNAPSYLITRSVQKIGLLQTQNYEPIYSIATNWIGENVLITSLLFILSLSRGFLLLMLLFVLNIIIGCKFKKHMEQKRRVMPTKLSTATSN